MHKILISALALTAALSSAPAFAVGVGEKAPDFKLKGSDGKTYHLADFTKKGQIVVLEWFNKDCPYVRKFYDTKTMQGLQHDATAKNVAWLTIASSSKGKEGHLDASNAATVRTEKAMNNTALLLDGDSAVAKLFGAKTTPHMFVIDKKGVIAYQGAIDDSPTAKQSALAGAQNYVKAALASLENGEPIKTPSTTPYGCSVKY
jgi:peroxiredoxin